MSSYRYAAVSPQPEETHLSILGNQGKGANITRFLTIALPIITPFVLEFKAIITQSKSGGKFEEDELKQKGAGKA